MIDGELFFDGAMEWTVLFVSAHESNERIVVMVRA